MAAMDTLFSDIERSRRKANAPLAARVRPHTLDGYVGQAQAVGEGSWLRRAIEHDTLFSLILYGPAGTGKTYIAVAMAISAYKNKEIQKIILARPAVEAGENNINLTIICF